MKLSTRTTYGTRALLDIALTGNTGKPTLLKDIAQRQQISPIYLEHLIAPLISANILKSMRGAKGGVWLARPPDQIKLSEIIQVLEGSISLVECVDDPKTCPRYESCVTRDVWTELKNAMTGVLETTTLQNLVEKQQKKEDPSKAMYYI